MVGRVVAQRATSTRWAPTLVAADGDTTASRQEDAKKAADLGADSEDPVDRQNRSFSYYRLLEHTRDEFG